jgi:predicted N-acyltransferase
VACRVETLKKHVKKNSNDYVIRVLESPLDIGASDWNALLARQRADGTLNPFMRHEYLTAMHQSGCATPKSGWTPRFVTLWHGTALAGACALYLKDHSYGEYVFDHAWAHAYRQHGLAYYPKALVAAPFTPVPGARLLARNATERLLLLKALIAWCEAEKLSSLHMLFAGDADVAACEEAGLMLRHTVQFHWSNMAPTLAASRAALPPGGAVPPKGGLSAELAAPTLAASRAALPPAGAEPAGFKDFDDFLMSLNQEKRKKIRQERRKVADAGITFRCSKGTDISNADWDFFYTCYERTYYEHGNAPYLSRDFFRRMQDDMPENWLMFVAEHTGPDEKSRPVACSLVALSAPPAGSNAPVTAYGRYWGALARVDCLHFEACYYQPLEWCIAHGVQRFEGGAQGEHKMARALLPVMTTSAHWLAHPAFADAVERFLEREGAGISDYMSELESRNPFKVQI